MSTAEATSGKVEAKKDTKGMATVGRLFGAVGLVLLVSTPLTWLLTEEMGPLVWGKLVLGTLFVIVYAATNPDVFGRVAGSRSSGLMAMSGLTVVVVVGLLGAANFIAHQNPKQFDLTKEGLYTLSSQTTELLGRLQHDVTIYAFYSSNDPDFAAVQETLGRYRDQGTKVRFEMVDPQARPDLVEQYQITERGPRLVITARGQDARAKDANEEELTNGIMKVAEQNEKALYFLTGHGEGDITDGDNAEGYKQAAEALRTEGYKVEPLSLLAAAGAAPGAKVEVGGAAAPGSVAVPDNVAVLVIAGARKPLLAPELAALEAYLGKGGRVVALIEPDSDAGLANLLAQYKIAANKDLVVDTNPINRMLGFGAAAPILQPTAEQVQHPALKGLAAPAIVMAARSLKFAEGGLPGVDAVPLLETGESAWGETNLVGGAAELDAKDHAGPVAVMMAATKSVEAEGKLNDEARLFVAGDSEWVSNKYLNVQGNLDLFVNTVHWLAEEQARIAIRPKSRTSAQLFLTGEQMGQLKFVAMDLFPVLIVAMGLGIVLVRRQR